MGNFYLFRPKLYQQFVVQDGGSLELDPRGADKPQHPRSSDT